MNTPEKRSDFEAVNLLLFLWKGRVLIIAVCVLALIGAIIASLSIRPKFKSAAIIFPAKSNTISLVENSNPKDNIYNFGEEEEAEQLVQILQSSAIRDVIVEKYDLWKHYDIDLESNEKMYLLQGEYEENMTFRRTKFGSIEIAVMDWSPDTAALIANDIVMLLDSAKSHMIKERAYTAYQVIEEEYRQTNVAIQTVVDSLTSLGAKGVVSKVERAELNAGYTQALILGRTAAADELKRQLDVNSKYGAIYSSLIEKLENNTKRVTELESVYKQAKANFEARLSYQFISELAFPADKKAYPIRWLIVVMAGISAFVFSIFLLIAIQKIKEMRVRLAEEKAA